MKLNGKELTIKLELYRVTDFMGRECYGIALFSEDKNGEPYAGLTICFGELIGMKDCAYMDTNNCPWVKELVEAGVAVDTGFTKHSGFCEYPLYAFDEDFLKGLDAVKYAEYVEKYKEVMGLC